LIVQGPEEVCARSAVVFGGCRGLVEGVGGPWLRGVVANEAWGV